MGIQCGTEEAHTQRILLTPLTAALKGACNPSLHRKLPDHAQKAPVLQQPVPVHRANTMSHHTPEAMLSFGKIRKQRQKNPQVTFWRPRRGVRTNHQPVLVFPYHLPSRVPAATMLGMELVAGEHLLALARATAEFLKKQNAGRTPHL